MTGLEIENFYKLDKKEYVLERNKEFLKVYKKMLEDNCCYLEIDELQNLIDEIVLFFEFKYPNKMFKDVIYNFEKNKYFYNYKELYKKMEVLALVKAWPIRLNGFKYYKYYKMDIYLLKGFNEFIDLLQVE